MGGGRGWVRRARNNTTCLHTQDDEEEGEEEEGEERVRKAECGW